MYKCLADHATHMIVKVLFDTVIPKVQGRHSSGVVGQREVA